MWTEHYRAVCQEHSDLLAVYESPEGRLALLLRHPLAPERENGSRWFHETRHTARKLIAGLRAAGLAAEITVLQWRPLARVADVMEHWLCRYDADPARRHELADQIARLLAGGTGWGAVPAWMAPKDSLSDNDGALPLKDLSRWYHEMTATWLATEPPARRQLILCSHRWIVERVLLPLSRDEEPPVEDLQPMGTLARRLIRTLPDAEAGSWKPWMRVLLIDLQRALTWPGARRTQAWLRWLFLIPYSIPVRGRREGREAEGVREESRRLPMAR